jgi:hypothetical protein
MVRSGSVVGGGGVTVGKTAVSIGIAVGSGAVDTEQAASNQQISRTNNVLNPAREKRDNFNMAYPPLF